MNTINECRQTNIPATCDTVPHPTMPETSTTWHTTTSSALLIQYNISPLAAHNALWDVAIYLHAPAPLRLRTIYDRVWASTTHPVAVRYLKMKREKDNFSIIPGMYLVYALLHFIGHVTKEKCLIWNTTKNQLINQVTVRVLSIAFVYRQRMITTCMHACSSLWPILNAVATNL